MALGIVFSLIGIALLARAADAFVEGAAKLAILLKLSPVVIGAVVIGFGTSAPEMLVSGLAAIQGDTDLGVGNVIGSNIANLSLILGSTALLVTVTVTAPVIRREALLSTSAAVVFAALLVMNDGLSRRDGLLLLVLMVAALWWIIQAGAVDHQVPDLEDDESLTSTRAGLETLVGLAGTVLGAYLLVRGATSLADEFGLNDGFVGVTLVAIGTSLPELVTSVSAARKNEVELIVGNLLGSNLFNSLGVGAVIGLLGDGILEPDSSLQGVDTLFMLIVCVGAFIFMLTRRVFSRNEGIILLGVFAVFLVSTWLQQDPDTSALVTPFLALTPG